MLVAAALPAWGKSPGQDALDQGVAQYKEGRFQDALGSFQRAVDLDPSLIKAWENMGWARHRLGDDAEALRLWHTVLKLEPDNVPSWNAVGEVELARGANRDAAAALEKSLALDGGQSDVRLRLGEAYEKLERDDAAAAQYRAILSRKPGDEKASLRLADVEEARGRLDQAEAVLRAGLGRDVGPEGPVEMRLARVLAKRGDRAFAQGLWDDAAGAYTEAASRDPERPVYLSNLGWARRRSGSNGAAVAAWKLAIERGSEKPADLWRAIGDAERDAGRPAEARDAYERAAKAAPGTSSALISLAAVALEDGDTAAAGAAVRKMIATGAGARPTPSGPPTSSSGTRPMSRARLSSRRFRGLRRASRWRGSTRLAEALRTVPARTRKPRPSTGKPWTPIPRTAPRCVTRGGRRGASRTGTRSATCGAATPPLTRTSRSRTSSPPGSSSTTGPRPGRSTRRRPRLRSLRTRSRRSGCSPGRISPTASTRARAISRRPCPLATRTTP
jgi:tetratricopeptide (TPR) repeat protein